MRDTFVRILTEEAKRDSNIILITGDLGFGVLNNFMETFPKQFINAGIAEQSMTGIASGMALEGKKVFTYSIANFPTLRCLEQIRNDAAYHNANLKIVAIGAGFAYGALGMSHHATEDLAIMRALPNVTVFSPGDLYETEAITKAAVKTEGTVYMRLGKGGEKNVHQNTLVDYRVGDALEVIERSDINIFVTGAILSEAVKASELLLEGNIHVGVTSFPTVKPIDMKYIKDMATSSKIIITLEEHNIIGGLGGAVSEIVAEMPNRTARIVRFGIDDHFSSVVGSQDYMRECNNLSAHKIAERIKLLISEVK